MRDKKPKLALIEIYYRKLGANDFGSSGWRARFAADKSRDHYVAMTRAYAIQSVALWQRELWDAERIATERKVRNKRDGCWSNCHDARATWPRKVVFPPTSKVNGGERG